MSTSADSPPPTPPAPAPPASSRRRRPALVLLLALGVALAGWWQLRPRGPTPPAVPAEGVREDVAAAVTAARNAVVENPRSGPAWGHLGLVLTAHGFDDRATACFREAHRLDPADDRWPYLLGLYYLTDGRDPAAAVGYLETALACPHRSARGEGAVRLRLAELYLKESKLSAAERLFRDHLARDPADPRGRVGLGETLLTADRPAEAVGFFQGATDSPFTRRKAASGLAVASRLLGRPDDAARYDRQTARLPEDLPPADPFAAEAAGLRVEGRGGYDEVQALENEGRVRDTIPILLRMAEDPADVRAAVALGRNLSLLGEFAAAEPYLRAACAREPGNVQAALALGTALFDQAQSPHTDPDRKVRLLRDAADAAARALKLMPDLGMAHLCRGMALRALGDRPAALAHLRLAAECRPEVVPIQLALLQALVDDGLLDEAKARLPTAERVVPADHPRLAAIRDRLASAPPGLR